MNSRADCSGTPQRIVEGPFEWSATGPENQAIVMSDGRSLGLPSPGLQRSVSAAEIDRL